MPDPAHDATLAQATHAWPPSFEEVLRRHLTLLPPDHELTADLELAACGMDSLGAVNLLLDLEDTHAVQFPDSLLTSSTFATVASLWAVVARLANPDADIYCSYSGAAGAGVAGLTWAQQFMWEVVHATGGPVADFDLLVVPELGQPLSISAAEDLIRQALLRHPVLRTSISSTVDGTPVQRVNAAGSVPITVHVTDDPSSVEFGSVLPGTAFDTLFRCLFVVRDGLVCRIALRISHVLTDAAGGKLLSDDLAKMAATVPASSMSPSPLELARFEAGEEGRRIKRESLDHAKAVYDISPPTMWSRRHVPQSPRYRVGQLRSSDLLAALPVLSHDLRVTRFGVLAASLAVTTALASGQDSALLFLISGNRFDADWAMYPGMLSQEAILHLPIGPTIRETMRTATREAARSLRRARYSPAEMDAVRRAAEDRRGVSFDKLGSAVVLNLIPADVEFNDSSANPARFAWTDATDAENLGCYVDAWEGPTDFIVSMRFDTSLMKPQEAEARVRAMEWIIVSAASRDLTVEELRAHLTPQQ
jgi:acyl carrier protein